MGCGARRAGVEVKKLTGIGDAWAASSEVAPAAGPEAKAPKQNTRARVAAAAAACRERTQAWGGGGAEQPPRADAAAA